MLFFFFLLFVFRDGFESLLNVIENSLRTASPDFGIAGGISWGDGYCFPPDLVNRDLARFTLARENLVTMVTESRSEHFNDRFNEERVSSKLCFAS